MPNTPENPKTTTLFDQIVRARRSVRGFKPEQVAPATLRAIFDTARWAPSNCNVQPWTTHLVSGDALRKLGQSMSERAQSGTANPDVVMDTAYTGEFRARQVGSAVALYSAMGIARDDAAGRMAAFARNLDAFGAPHAAFIFLPENFGIREAADLGGYVQTLLLAMTAHGLGSCAQGALSLYPDVVRSTLGLTEGPQLMCGIAFGYEDPDHPANAARTTRVDLDELLTLHGAPAT